MMQACIHVCLILSGILFNVQSLVDTMLILKREKTQTYVNNGILESLCYVLVLTSLIFCCMECDNFSLAVKRTLLNIPKKRFSC